MDCKIARQKLFVSLDYEIDAETKGSPSEHFPLDKHLTECADCRREYRLLSLARAVGSANPPVTASAWFYQQLSRRIEDERAQGIANRQTVWKLAYRMIPALAGITLTLASIFVLQEAQPSAKTPHSYDYVFIADDAARRMLADDQDDITYESILAALAERYGSD